MKKQQSGGWCIFEPKGEMLPLTIGITRKESILKMIGPIYEWDEWKKSGWTCRKVIITEI